METAQSFAAPYLSHPEVTPKVAAPDAFTASGHSQYSQLSVRSDKRLRINDI